MTLNETILQLEGLAASLKPLVHRDPALQIGYGQLLCNLATLRQQQERSGDAWQRRFHQLKEEAEQVLDLAEQAHREVMRALEKLAEAGAVPVEPPPTVELPAVPEATEDLDEVPPNAPPAPEA